MKLEAAIQLGLEVDSGDLVQLYSGLDDDYIAVTPDYDTKEPRRKMTEIENVLLGLSLLKMTDRAKLEAEWPTYTKQDKAEFKALSNEVIDLIEDACFI